MRAIVDRLESMSPDGSLTLFLQNDGDVIVQVRQTTRHGNPYEPVTASVEFCTPGGGGGGSPETWKALSKLMMAMARDNADPHSIRSGEHPGTELLRPKEHGQGDVYVLWYEDPDRRTGMDETYAGEGAREAALKAYDLASAAWSCKLFKSVDPDTLR